MAEDQDLNPPENDPIWIRPPDDENDPLAAARLCNCTNVCVVVTNDEF